MINGPGSASKLKAYTSHSVAVNICEQCKIQTNF